MRYISLVIAGLVLLCMEVRSHGYLVDPLGRDSAWRVHPGYFRINYNDNQVFCGGFATQHEQNGGRCGFCGDDYSDPRPRSHERGGYYASNNIVAQYQRGRVIEVSVKVTANHRGAFFFDLCVNNDPLAAEDETCFRKLAPVGSRPGTDNYTLPTTDTGDYVVSLRLPDDVTCSYCVLRWKYLTGNSWGCQDDGSDCCVGCGEKQETFYACADVMITESGQEPVPAWLVPDKDTRSTRSPDESNTTSTTSTTTTTTLTTTVPESQFLECPSMCRAYCGTGFKLLCRAYCCSCSQYRHLVSIGCPN